MARLLLWHLQIAVALVVCSLQGDAASPSNPIQRVHYVTEQPFEMNMTSTREIVVVIIFDRASLPPRGADMIGVTFRTSTIAPQFNILSLNSDSVRSVIARQQLEQTNYQLLAKVKLHANYIGHALLYPASVDYVDSKDKKVVSITLGRQENALAVTIVQYEGIWGTIFIVSVSLLIIISYINVGAQLDEDNLRLMIRRPLTLILGSLIGIMVMPALAWLLGAWFFRNQLLFRIGSFVFAAGPAATASTLWTVMLNSDKELSVGLQVISTISALFTMPLFLYLLDRSLSGVHTYEHIVKVPYARLTQTLFTLLVALFLGWLLGRNKRRKELSARIFRPLIFSVLIFIIVFSSILYWHIYQMFDWNITLASLLITLVTYAISATLGFLINCDLDRAVAISITSAYKNSGIAFAVLMVAFQSPDLYIAYVPCLTQVVTTSLTLYLTYAIASLVRFLKRRGQPDVIQASKPSSSNDEDLEAATGNRRRSSADSKGRASNSQDDDDDEHSPRDDELIAMNVTDIDAGSPTVVSNEQPANEHGASTSMNRFTTV